MGEDKNYPIEVKKEILRSALDSLWSTIGAKLDTLSTISGLVATLLIIATFNEKILEITLFVKILIAALLFLMLLSLLFRLLDLNMAEESIIEQIDKVTGLDSKKIIKEKRKARGRRWEILNTIIGYSPFVIFAIFAFIVIAIICLIFTQKLN